MRGIERRGWWRRVADRLSGARQLAAIEALGRDLADLRSELHQIKAQTAPELKRIHDAVTLADIGARRNVGMAMERLSVIDSGRLATREMLKARSFSHPHDTLAHALKLAPSGGLALEFGVYSGTTLGIIAKARLERPVFGFDSFEGLPEAWRDNFPAGAFAVQKLPQVDGAELVVGWFDQTLPGFLQQHPGPVDFLHIDCDLYSSTRTVLDHVGPRLRPGSIVAFDEFFNYPGWQEHEYRAWTEYAQRSGTRFSYVGYTFNNEQVALRIDETSSTTT